jgi:hypothetical protein
VNRHETDFVLRRAEFRRARDVARRVEPFHVSNKMKKSFQARFFKFNRALEKQLQICLRARVLAVGQVCEKSGQTRRIVNEAD